MISNDIQNSVVMNDTGTESMVCDVAVIGGGPAGYEAAIRCAQNGLSTVLIEKNRLGGTCLNAGCIPTKTLVSVANLLTGIKRAEDFGVSVQDYQFSLEKIRDRMQQVVSSLVKGIEFLMKTNKIRVIHGNALVKEKGLLTVEGGNQEVACKNLILATGSVSTPLPIPGADASDILTSHELLELKEIPESLTIIGGGVIGMEFAFIYAALGCKVHVVEFLPQILNLVDSDAASMVKRSAKKMGIQIYESARALSIETTPEGKKQVTMERKGKNQSLVTDRVAVAVGRRANLGAVDLERLDVELNDKKNGIRVNEVMQTSNPWVYAVGDVTHQVMLAHAASRQGILAADHMAGKAQNAGLSPFLVPSAIFTCPEIGHIGYSEKEATEKNLDITTGKAYLRANGKAVAMQEAEGFVKVVADRQTREIIGFTMVGAEATELLSLATHLVTCRVTLDKASQVIYAHPTVSEAILGAIENAKGN